MNEKESAESLKRSIDAMSHEDLCRRWRFSAPGDPYFQGEVGQYFKKKLFEENGGFTPGISKHLGWTR